MKIKYNIVQKMVDDTHYYWVDGEFFPSVTRILDVAAPKEYGLINWFKNNTAEDIEAKSKEAVDNGTLVHDACEKLLNGIEISIKDYPVRAKKALMSLASEDSQKLGWFETYKPTNITTEQMVASKELKYAGTLDLVCNINGKRCLVDFKTNKSAIYFSNKLQVMAYKKAYEESTGDKIDECYVLRLGSQHKVGYEFLKVEDVTVNDFMKVYGIYLTMNGGKIEDPPVIDVYPETLKLNLKN